MKRTRQRDARELGSSRDRGPDPVTGGSATRSRRDKVGAVHAAAGNQAVQRQQASGQEKVGEWWGGRGYREPTKAERERGFATADVQQAVTAWMQDEGIAPPSGEVNLADYVDVDMVISSESSTPTTSARIRVGPNGNLLPTMATIEERKPQGGYEEGSLRTATTWIQFEFHKIPDGGLYIQTSKLDTKQRPNGTVVTMTKAADTDMSIRGRENYTLAGDERVPRSLGDMIESAGIQPGEAASRRTPSGTQSGQQPGSSPGGVPLGGTGAATGAAAGAFIKNIGSKFAPGAGVNAVTGTETHTPEKDTGSKLAPGAGVNEVGGTETYTTEKGDNLSSIAAQVYGDQQKWPVIFMANEKGPENPTGIEDPDLIQPNQELTIPPQRRAEQFDYASWEPPADLGVGKGKF